MLIAAPDTTEPAPTEPPSLWDRVKYWAGRAEHVVDAPVEDLAAVIGVSTIWLGGVLLGLKMLTTGLVLMRRCPVPPRK